ncbi:MULTISPECIES: DEAD/DEAH box helicase [Myxococcus]|uniref:DEAD/DEAH box helicase n=1 Tax=Myxococcus TaxID=32 RepID=UPI0011428D7D|nr:MULTISPECIES: DEAD/DEAH box helicase [Myxococcus]NOK05434.1 DEAD/DEAH box helicase [Myxococcus xanthus]
MKPDKSSQLLLSATRSKAKMFEYSVPPSEHINLSRDPAELLTLTIGVLGELSARLNAHGIEDAKLEELQLHMLFSARYFDAYRQTNLASDLDSYLLLLGSASYYLCNFPGSASVLAYAISSESLELSTRGLEQLLLWLLKGNFSSDCVFTPGPYTQLLENIQLALSTYYSHGGTEEQFINASAELRRTAYIHGTARELLLADTVSAVVRRRFENSARLCLPTFSNIPEADWANTLSKPRFLHELWPAQKLLGEKGVFEGKSAVVQMPTSAGKSRATEIIIRSAFLAERATLAVVVAPFRALCHEIRDNLLEAFHGEPVNVDELSDVSQADFDVEELLAIRSVLILTPEKLVYTLRHSPEIAKQIGLLIYDEGHQFDTGSRGVTYELLIASLKTMIPLEIQTILISAVLSNAAAIGEWLNADEPNVVAGGGLIPTERTVAFASWQDHLGRLDFVEPDTPNKIQFFVPRVIEAQQLQHNSREKARSFPDRNNGATVALYLGLKLAHNGSVAIFCGRKSTVTSLCETLLDAYARGLELKPPLAASASDEVQRIASLCIKNLGADAAISRSAALGVFTHHGNTPHGIRLAVEHAMKTGLARLVICTSTLAQGVNLPIRYLIVTSVYQGRDPIKNRDFHNLIGRAGRSGMHTEGSVIFADPSIYDGREIETENWRWSGIQSLLRTDTSEPCESTILSVLAFLQSDNRRSRLSLDPIQLIQAYISSPNTADWVSQTASSLSRKGFSKEVLTGQLTQKVEILAAIESFLMAHWDDIDANLPENGVRRLAEETLAYHLASDDDRERLIETFSTLAAHVASKASAPAQRKLFARTLYGLKEAIETETWVIANIDAMIEIESTDELLSTLWPLILARIQNSTFRKCRPQTALQPLTIGWMNGHSFGGLYAELLRINAKIGGDKQPRKAKLEHVIELCENALGYEGTLAIGAVIEFTSTLRPDSENLISHLKTLQKRMRYGLPTACSVMIYELGFSDRVVATDLLQIVGECSSRGALRRELFRNESEVRAILEQYPAYFALMLNRITG